VVSDGEEAVARAQFEKLGWGEELFELIVGADSGARAGPCVAVRPCGRVAVWPCGRVAVVAVVAVVWPTAREHAEGAALWGSGVPGCGRRLQ
jgi:hypothetical protein